MWIPCKDRLPKTAGMYLVTVEDSCLCDGEIFKETYSVQAVVRKDFDGRRLWTFMTSEGAAEMDIHNELLYHSETDYTKITAWQELPAPYEEGNVADETSIQTVASNGKWIASTKHNWQRDENGEIDENAWDRDTHNGVVCKFCGCTPCVYCEPDWMKNEDCEPHFECSFCGNFSEDGHEAFCSCCGAKMTVRIHYK